MPGGVEIGQYVLKLTSTQRGADDARVLKVLLDDRAVFGILRVPRRLACLALGAPGVQRSSPAATRASQHLRASAPIGACGTLRCRTAGSPRAKQANTATELVVVGWAGTHRSAQATLSNSGS